MKIKILSLALILSFSSCGIFIVSNVASNQDNKALNVIDNPEAKFLGDYNIKVFGTPEGDLELKINVSQDGDGLKSTFESEEASNAFEITGTEIEQGILYIDIYVSSYGVNVSFEIYVDGDQVTGYLADMFELEGTKTN